MVLGGQLTPELEHHLRRCRALIFPTDPHAPVDPYRATLYRPAGAVRRARRPGYAATPDARAYRWSRDASTRSDAFVTLLRAIHDDSMSDALDELVAGRSVVGVMGGHALARGTPPYAAAASPGAVAGPRRAPGRHRRRARRDGGGQPRRLLPGPGRAWRTALGRLAAVPSFAPDVTAWAAPGAARCGRTPHRATDAAPSSIGVPTWFYGHEPPNVFVDRAGQVLLQRLREDGLLARCNAGVVVLPGAAGTVQEIFQAATPPLLRPRRRRLRSSSSAGEHWTRGGAGVGDPGGARRGPWDGRAPYTWWTHRRRRWSCSSR